MEWVSVGTNLTVDERMSCQDKGPSKEFTEIVREAFDEVLTSQALPPVLLALPAVLGNPPVVAVLFSQATQNCRRRRPEASPVTRRTHCVDRSAVRASPALHRDRLIESIEVSADIPMAPRPGGITSQTACRSRPRVPLSETHQIFKIDRYVQYQGSTPGIGVGMTEGANLQRSSLFYSVNLP